MLPKVFLLLFASLPAPTMSSSEISNSWNEGKYFLSTTVRILTINTLWKGCTTLTPLSLRNGVRAGAIGARLLGGLNMLGAVGLRNGALGIPLRGAGDIDKFH